MEGNSMYYDVLFATWGARVKPILAQLQKKGLNIDATDDEIFTWWGRISQKQWKMKQAETVEALNYVYCMRLRQASHLFTSTIDANSAKLSAKNVELHQAEAKIQDLESQIAKLVSEQLALFKKYKTYEDFVADLKNKLSMQETMSTQTLNSDGAKKDATYKKEKACSRSQESVPISVIEVMQNHAGAEPHGVDALESHRTPPVELSKPDGKDNRLCSSCHKIGHTEDKCWSLGRGRPPPYYFKCGKQFSEGKGKQSANNHKLFVGKTLSELTALFMQGLQLLTSLAGGLAAQ